jgi:hypothetical protein
MSDREAAQPSYRMVFEEIDPTEKEHIRQALLEYCKRETLGRVELRQSIPHTASVD